MTRRTKLSSLCAIAAGMLAATIRVGADPSDTRIADAVMNGDKAAVASLLKGGADVKATTRLGGYTPIFIASRNGNAALVEALLAAGADGKTASTTGTTPL